VPGFDASVTHLSEPEHFNGLKESGHLLMGSVPLLCIDGLKLVQSQAIVRYLARKHGLCGDPSSAADAVTCDIVAETVLDWKRAVGVAFEYSINGHEPSDEQRATLAAGNAKFLPKLEACLGRNGEGKHFVGAELTYSDIVALEPLEQIAPYEDLAEFPLMKQLHTMLLANPRLSAFLASDRRKMKSQAGVVAYKAGVARTLAR
jgi:glutathione S-transferase